MASTTRRPCRQHIDEKRHAEIFGPRQRAAPKKLDPTIRPQATSSAHSTGALNRKRSSTDVQTTRRSAASSTAAITSLREEQRRSDPAAAAWRGCGG